MLVEASISGFFRTVLILIGVFVLLRFLGRLIQAKRNIEAERIDIEKQREYLKKKERIQRDFGKTKIVSKTNTTTKSNFEDVDYEPVEK